ncbi:MAG: hypothetical protein IJ057_02130, partial [Bacteroidales bacterium]|nr:hypothetical protein [Bacteroidales bacterium]
LQDKALPCEVQAERALLFEVREHDCELPEPAVPKTQQPIIYGNLTTPVNEVGGLILLPDDWDANTYSLNNANSDAVSAYFNDNPITAAQWTILEDAGAVFLPAAGSRSGVWVVPFGPLKGSCDFSSPNCGYYWSASYANMNDAQGVFFLEGGLHKHNSRRFISNCDRFYGLSVRLVQDAN